MKLTAIQLRRIIKEEVQKVMKSSKKRALREMVEEADASFEIPEISVHAEGSDMSVQEFVGMVKGMAKKYKTISFESEDVRDTGDGYSAVDDVLTAFGSRKELESLARELDEEFMGAQSLHDEDSFVNGIQDY